MQSDNESCDLHDLDYPVTGKYSSLATSLGIISCRQWFIERPNEEELNEPMCSVMDKKGKRRFLPSMNRKRAGYGIAERSNVLYGLVGLRYLTQKTDYKQGTKWKQFKFRMVSGLKKIYRLMLLAVALFQ